MVEKIVNSHNMAGGFYVTVLLPPAIYRNRYVEAVLKFAKLKTAAQQREAVVQGRSLLPYRLRYKLLVTIQ
jgi:hypothetical protein